MSHTILLNKVSKRRLNEDIIRQNINGIIGRATAGDRGKQGWSCISWMTPKPLAHGDNYIYRTRLDFKKRKSNGAEVDDIQFERLVGMAVGACSNNGRWEILSEDGTPMTVVEPVDSGATVEPLTVADGASIGKIEIGKLNLDLGNHFDHIYDRDAQIQILHSALVAFEESGGLNKFNVLYAGPPGCGKTEILHALVQMVGEDAVLKMDASSTTKAGAEKTLLNSKYKPKLLVIEELEKAPESSLQYLLGLLDHRSEIRKINYRENSHRNIKLLCFATVNDMPLFKSLMSGALASRFPNQVYCPRPSAEIMRKILLREVIRFKGKEEWIDPTLQYCQENHIDDPREAITVCLCGREKLMDGSYQGYLHATRMPA
jgi:hypothetical protein